MWDCISQPLRRVNIQPHLYLIHCSMAIVKKWEAVFSPDNLICFTDSPVNVTVSGYAAYPSGVSNISQYGILTCTASGYPAVTYGWQWNDGITEQFAVGSSLVATELGRRNYSCIATNALGSALSTVAMDVTGERMQQLKLPARTQAVNAEEQ